MDHGGGKSPSTVVLMTHNNNTMKSFERKTREENSNLEVKMVSTGQLSFAKKPPTAAETPKEGGIIVNQNQHFKYKMRRPSVETLAVNSKPGPRHPNKVMARLLKL